MRLWRLNRFALAVGALALVGLADHAVKAADIVESWNTMKLPSVPEVKPVTVNSKETALLVLDFNAGTCNAEKRPRCVDSLPKVAKLLASARSAGAMVVYVIVGNGKVEDIPAAVAAKPGEPVIHSAGVDKFLGTDLEKTLKDKGIRSVIVVGTSAHGAVLYTASEAALRDFNVIVPVDGMSADDPFAELSTAWILVNAPTSVSKHVTLTRTNLLSF